MRNSFFLASVLALMNSAAWARPIVNSRSGPPLVSDSMIHYGWADVLRVDPIYRVVRINHPQQECHQVQVVHQEGADTTASSMLGAVIGGALGHTVGKGDGRKAATVAGAVVGGALGHRLAGRNQGSYENIETRCHRVNSVRRERHISGYDVEYRYHGRVYLSRLNYDPGKRLRVRVSVSPAD